MAAPLLASTLTGDLALVVGVYQAQNLAALVSSVPAGLLADRFDRGRLLSRTGDVVGSPRSA